MLECRMGKINNKDLRFEVLTLVTVFWLWLYSVADTNVMEESSFSKNILFYWEALYKKSHTDERIILKFLKPSRQLKSVHFLSCVRWLKGEKYPFYCIGYHWHVYDLGVLDYCIQWNIKDISETGSVSHHMWREGVPGDPTPIHVQSTCIENSKTMNIAMNNVYCKIQLLKTLVLGIIAQLL
jgi:hypothetical protein